MQVRLPLSNETARWSTRTDAAIGQDLTGLIGFTSFKEGLAGLRKYCANIRSSGGRGVYNVVLINNCDAEIEYFTERLFDALSAEGIISDHVIGTGDVDDALISDRTTAHLCRLVDRWDGEIGTYRFGAIPAAEAFRKLAKRSTVYVADMDKAQYEKMCIAPSFRMLFPHAIHLDDLTAPEKLALLCQEALTLGFQVSPDDFINSELLCLPYQGIKAAVMEAAIRKQQLVTVQPRKLTQEDFLMIEPDSDRSDPMAELSALIGMEEVKNRVKEIVTFLKRRGKASLPCLHMVFRGNPGTGKTTVARIIGRVFAGLGVIERRGVFVETDRAGLIAQYVGHTAIKTERRVKEAMGGVLFIDEAYSLGMYNRGHDFGEECIATLVKAMEDHRQDFVCIMAGYTDKMNNMLATNPGLKHRIQFYVDFPDYDSEELTEIFISFCHKGGYTMDEQAARKIKECFALISKNKGGDFANARLVRKVYERVQICQALRTGEMEIAAEDIASAFDHQDMLHILHGEKARVVGFSRGQ